MENKTIKLPEAEEMHKRLLSVLNEGHADQKLYPLIISSLAGQEKYPQGVVMALVLALTDYCEGLPPITFGLMYNYLPLFIDALIDDKEAVEAAKLFLNSVDK